MVFLSSKMYGTQVPILPNLTNYHLTYLSLEPHPTSLNLTELRNFASFWDIWTSWDTQCIQRRTIPFSFSLACNFLKDDGSLRKMDQLNGLCVILLFQRFFFSLQMSFSFFTFQNSGLLLLIMWRLQISQCSRADKKELHFLVNRSSSCSRQHYLQLASPFSSLDDISAGVHPYFLQLPTFSINTIFLWLNKVLLKSLRFLT